jgi:sensor histidine kinase regulating citrate/malate metabolism
MASAGLAAQALAAAADAIITVNTHGEITSWNRAAEVLAYASRTPPHSATSTGNPRRTTRGDLNGSPCTNHQTETRNTP